MGNDRLDIDMLAGARQGEAILVLQGVLNANTAFAFRDLARRHETDTLILDMSAVRSVDSSGLGVLIGMYASCERANRRLLLAGLNDRIWDLFRTCKIEGVFTRYRTVSEAETANAASGESVVG